MSLLHAVWLPNPGAPHLALWADTWRVAKPRKLDGLEEPMLHPPCKTWRGLLCNRAPAPCET